MPRLRFPASESPRRVDDVVTGGFGRTLARARSHLFPSSSRAASWLGFGPLKGGWASRITLALTSALLLVCTYEVLRVFVSWTYFCDAPVCIHPSGFFVYFFVYTTEFFVVSHWFPLCCGGSAGPSLRVAGLCLRVAGCACVLRAAPASTRVEPRTEEAHMRPHFCRNQQEKMEGPHSCRNQQEKMEVHSWVCAHQGETLVEARSDTHFKFPRARATGHGDESCCVTTWAFGLERL